MGHGLQREAHLHPLDVVVEGSATPPELSIKLERLEVLLSYLEETFNSIEVK